MTKRKKIVLGGKIVSVAEDFVPTRRKTSPGFVYGQGAVTMIGESRPRPEDVAAWLRDRAERWRARDMAKLISRSDALGKRR